MSCLASASLRVKLLGHDACLHRKRRPPDSACTSCTCRFSSHRRPNVDAHSGHTNFADAPTTTATNCSPLDDALVARRRREGAERGRVMAGPGEAVEGGAMVWSCARGGCDWGGLLL
ncbi:unnamed protein product [Chondrus crispus]|uniref:Uncharacterized protein n=1 Tax=Chondrus crispus TaxID=2769 RepID=R7QGL5_CHOCR|nr:unnamed protein product [Chondrus crispus]CDF36601.1 unnamed protein product [Chondrus crispus]|eukprot:XP_005716420.1 unnamed protein product [Chondrus crispus]